jgi:hypothetical protein
MDAFTAAILGILGAAVAKLWADARASARKCEADRERCEKQNASLGRRVAVLMDRAGIAEGDHV